MAEQGHMDMPEVLSLALGALSLADKPSLAALRLDLSKALKSDVPILARDGGFVSSGWSADLDNLRSLRDESRRIIAGLRADYAKISDVPTLKIKHNNVLGYFIEVTPKYADNILAMGEDSPFIHRQTLVSGVRFTTTKLAELDRQINSAGDKALALEMKIFEEFLNRATELSGPIRKAAHALAELDAYGSFAVWANEIGAVRPVIDNSRVFHIKAGRHPVVERALSRLGGAVFTPNDCSLDAEQGLSLIHI